MVGAELLSYCKIYFSYYFVSFQHFVANNKSSQTLTILVWTFCFGKMFKHQLKYYLPTLGHTAFTIWTSRTVRSPRELLSCIAVSLLSSCPLVTWAATPSTVTASCSGWSAGSRRKGCEFGVRTPCSATTPLNSATNLCSMSACSPVVRHTTQWHLASFPSYIAYNMHHARKSVGTRNEVWYRYQKMWGVFWASMQSERLSRWKELKTSINCMISKQA